MEAYREAIYEEFENTGRGSKQLPVKILKSVLGGRSNCSILPHWHDYMEILYFYRGSSIVQINKEYINVQSGQVVLLDAYDIHSIKGASEHLVLLFRPQLASDFYMDLKRAFQLPDKDKVLMDDDGGSRYITTVAANMKEIMEAHQQKSPGYEMSIRGSIYKIIAAICAYSHEKKQVFSGSHNYSLNIERLNSLIKYMDEHYQEGMSMAEAAEYLNLTPNYFCRFFRSAMGKTFVEYLNMYRCAKAEELIYTTEKTITEVALVTGFSSVSYFNRTYKKYKGVCPSSLRNEKDNIVQHNDNI